MDHHACVCVCVCLCLCLYYLYMPGCGTVCHHPPSLLRSSASLALFVNYPTGGTEHRQLDRSNLEISGCPILNSKYSIRNTKFEIRDQKLNTRTVIDRHHPTVCAYEEMPRKTQIPDLPPSLNTCPVKICQISPRFHFLMQICSKLYFIIAL